MCAIISDVATQPVEQPKTGRLNAEVIDWIGRDRIMYSSDCLDWDYADADHVFKCPLDPDQRTAVFGGTARKLYGIA